MNWLLKLLFSSLADFSEGVVKVLTNYINNIFDYMYKLNSEKLNLDTISIYISALSIALVVFFSIKQGIQIYGLNTDGDPDADPLEMITRISVTVATIICGNWFLKELLKMAGLIGGDSLTAISNITGKQPNFSDVALNLIRYFMATTNVVSFVLLIFVVILIVAFIIFIFKAAKRGVEITAFQLMLPIFAIDLLTTNKERWSSFFTDLIVTVFGYILQLIAFKIFMLIFAGLASLSDPLKMIDNIFLALAWMAFVLGAPKWLQKYSYSSGLGNTAKGGIRSSVQMLATSLMRR